MNTTQKKPPNSTHDHLCLNGSSHFENKSSVIGDLGGFSVVGLDTSLFSMFSASMNDSDASATSLLFPAMTEGSVGVGGNWLCAVKNAPPVGRIPRPLRLSDNCSFLNGIMERKYHVSNIVKTLHPNNKYQ